MQNATRASKAMDSEKGQSNAKWIAKRMALTRSFHCTRSKKEAKHAKQGMGSTQAQNVYQTRIKFENRHEVFARVIEHQNFAHFHKFEVEGPTCRGVIDVRCRDSLPFSSRCLT